MVSAYVVAGEDGDAPALLADLGGAGVAVVGQGDPQGMVEAVIRSAPDVLVCRQTLPDDALFAGIEALNQSAPRPTVVFTRDPDAERIDWAARSGIHCYVVNGYGPGRLRPLIHLAQARFRHHEALRAELADVHRRFDERKLIDQAKAILMRLRNLPEDEAYGALRTAAMKANKRMGHVARQVIEAARSGDAVNRAGRLRMMSQRLAKLYALGCDGRGPSEATALLGETAGLIDDHLAALGRSLSKATYGDLVEAIVTPARLLRSAVVAAPAPGRLGEVDALAETVLTGAEQLTASLEGYGAPAGLRLINVAGRQRMLSQRYAKQAVMRALGAGVPEASLTQTATAYGTASVYLAAVPLSSPALTTLFDTAATAWTELQAAAPDAGSPGGRVTVLRTSEILLSSFEALTEQYERSLAVLLAP